MDIKGLNKAEVLAALYNASKVQGMGLFQTDFKEMTTEEADQMLKESDDKFFDYVKGKVMKVRIEGDEIDTRNYNRDNGEGAAERALSKLLVANPLYCL